MGAKDSWFNAGDHGGGAPPVLPAPAELPPCCRCCRHWPPLLAPLLVLLPAPLLVLLPVSSAPELLAPLRCRCWPLPLEPPPAAAGLAALPALPGSTTCAPSRS